MKTNFKLLRNSENDDQYNYWKHRSPEERVAAVEKIREQYYSMLGYKDTPRIKKIFKMTKRDSENDKL